MNKIIFYGKIGKKTILDLITKYRKSKTGKTGLKEIFICMNGNKFEDSVEKMQYQLESGDYYINKYNIKLINIDGVKIYFVLSAKIDYNFITSYPVYSAEYMDNI